MFNSSQKIFSEDFIFEIVLVEDSQSAIKFFLKELSNFRQESQEYTINFTICKNYKEFKEKVEKIASESAHQSKYRFFILDGEFPDDDSKKSDDASNDSNKKDCIEDQKCNGVRAFYLLKEKKISGFTINYSFDPEKFNHAVNKYYSSQSEKIFDSQFDYAAASDSDSNEKQGKQPKSALNFIKREINKILLSSKLNNTYSSETEGSFKKAEHDPISFKGQTVVVNPSFYQRVSLYMCSLFFSNSNSPKHVKSKPVSVNRKEEASTRRIVPVS